MGVVGDKDVYAACCRRCLLMEADVFTEALQIRKKHKENDSQEDLYKMANEMLYEIDENGEHEENGVPNGHLNGIVINGHGLTHGDVNDSNLNGHCNGETNATTPIENSTSGYASNGTLENSENGDSMEMGDVVGLETSKVQRKLNFNSN